MWALISPHDRGQHLPSNFQIDCDIFLAQPIRLHQEGVDNGLSCIHIELTCEAGRHVQAMRAPGLSSGRGQYRWPWMVLVGWRAREWCREETILAVSSSLCVAHYE